MRRPQQPLLIKETWKLFGARVAYRYAVYHVTNRTSRAFVDKPPDPQRVENSSHVTKPEGTLPCTQQLPTWPYPQPDQSRRRPPIPFIKIHFNIILSSVPVFQVVSLLQASLTKPCIPFASPLYVLQASPISFSLVSSSIHYSQMWCLFK